jgi:adenylyl- and sulfurtransferase ThiI
VAEIDDRIRELKRQLEVAHTNQTRSELLRDTARASAEKARNALEQEFGVLTLVEAKQLVSDMETQLATKIAAIRSELVKLG